MRRGELVCAVQLQLQPLPPSPSQYAWLSSFLLLPFVYWLFCSIADAAADICSSILPLSVASRGIFLLSPYGTRRDSGRTSLWARFIRFGLYTSRSRGQGAHCHQSCLAHLGCNDSWVLRRQLASNDHQAFEIIGRETATWIANAPIAGEGIFSALAVDVCDYLAVAWQAVNAVASAASSFVADPAFDNVLFPLACTIVRMNLLGHGKDLVYLGIPEYQMWR